MLHVLIHRLERDLTGDVDATDRRAITPWLMQFSAGKPLKLSHPRLGHISYEGVGFSGSPALVFDQFVCHTIEDLVDRHLRAVEDALPAVPPAQLDEVVGQATGLLVAARTKLLNRAADIKGSLLRNGLDDLQPVRLGPGGVEPINVSQRLKDLAHHLRAQTMKISSATIKRLRAAVENLRAAGHEAFDQHLKKLVRILDGSELSAVSAELTEGVDVEAWIADGRARMSSMVGSGRLAWPTDHASELGHIIALLRHLANSDGAIDFSYDFYYVENSFDLNLGRFVEQVVVPFYKDFVLYLEERDLLSDSDEAAPTYSVTMNNPVGVALQQGTYNSVQNVRLNISVEGARSALCDLDVALEGIELPARTATELKAEIETIRAQLSKEKPSSSILAEAARSLRSVTEGLAAGIMTPPALAAIAALGSSLGLR